MARFLGIYSILVIVGMGLLELPMLDTFYQYFGIVLATLSGTIIRLVGAQVNIAGAVLSLPNGGFSIEVTTECQAIELTWLYCVAILAWTAAWQDKLRWILLGIALIQVLNVIRLISLVYLGHWYPDHFVMIHENFYPMFFGIMVILLFLNWIIFTNSSRVQHAIQPAPTF
jgi:exosortase/archaeosortase family protein